MGRSFGVCLLAVAIAAAGCGSDPSPGDAEPRRTLDPRAEAVRFFGAGTRALVLVRTDMPRPAREVADLLDHPYLGAILSDLGTRLASAGIQPAALVRLGRPEDGVGPGAEIVAGLTPGPKGTEALIVLPTDRPEDLERVFAAAKAEGGVRTAGEFDDATLFRGERAAFALRDGVLVAAESLDALRRAIAVRDGDESRQFDDGEVSGELEDVPTRAPVHLVARRGERFAGAAVRVEGGSVELRVAADVPEGDEGDEGPRRVTVPDEDLARLLTDLAGVPSPGAREIASIGPLRGASYVDGDRFVATFRIEPG